VRNRRRVVYYAILLLLILGELLGEINYIIIIFLEYDNMHDIIVITDSISVAQKILESKINPFQNIVIPLAIKIKPYLSKDARNNIHF